VKKIELWVVSGMILLLEAGSCAVAAEGIVAMSVGDFLDSIHVSGSVYAGIQTHIHLYAAGRRRVGCGLWHI